MDQTIDHFIQDPIDVNRLADKMQKAIKTISTD